MSDYNLDGTPKPWKDGDRSRFTRGACPSCGGVHTLHVPGTCIEPASQPRPAPIIVTVYPADGTRAFMATEAAGREFVREHGGTVEHDDGESGRRALLLAMGTMRPGITLTPAAGGSR